MKRRWTGSLLVLLVLSLSIHCSCGVDATESGEERLDIAVIPKGTSNVFWQTIHAGALAAGKKHGVQILWQGPRVETDKERQIAIIDDFTATGVDGIVLAPQDANAMVPAVNRVARANIPLVIMDSGINSEKYISYVATDNYGGGVAAARELARRLNGKGKAVMIGNDPGGQSTNAREKGFQETVENEFPEMEIVDFQYHYNARERARAVMEDLLVRHPEIDGVFCSNESSTLGASLALRAMQASEKVQFVGFDSSPELVTALEQGNIEAIVHQDPFRIGYDGVETMVRHLNGESVEKRINTGVYVVTQENMSEPDIARLLNPDLSILNE